MSTVRALCVGLTLALVACEARSGTTSGAAPASVAATPSAPELAPAPPAPELGPDNLYALAGLRYREYVSGGADAEATLPMIILIHGLGDTPEDFESLVRGFDTPARFIVPRGFETHGPGWSWFAFRGVDRDEAETAAAIDAAAQALVPGIEALTRARPTLGKPAVSGFSQGGMLSFTLAVRHGELLSAAYPIGGWLPEPLWPTDSARAKQTPPIFAYHGETDARVPYLPTYRAVTHLQGLGYAVELSTYAGLGHSISRELHTELMAAFRSFIARQSTD